MSEIKNITIDYLIDLLNKCETEDEVERVIKEKVLKTSYLPFEEKVELASKVVKSSYYVKKDTQTLYLHINSPASYMLYTLGLIDAYTYLKIDFNNAVKEFDKINKQKIQNLILYYMEEDELKEMQLIFDMVQNDTMQNEYEPHAFIRSQVERFGFLAGSIGKVLGDVWDSLTKEIQENSSINQELKNGIQFIKDKLKK